VGEWCSGVGVGVWGSGIPVWVWVRCMALDRCAHSGPVVC